MTKRCPSCGVDRPASAFWANAARADGLQSVCKECHYHKYNKHKDPGKVKVAGQKYWKSEHGKCRAYIYAIKHKYGLSPRDYQQMLNAQNRSCAVCGSTNGPGRRLCVDHDHVTGEVRGLLCDRCNKILGLAHDERLVLLSLATYLNRN